MKEQVHNNLTTNKKSHQHIVQNMTPVEETIPSKLLNYAVTPTKVATSEMISSLEAAIHNRNTPEIAYR